MDEKYYAYLMQRVILEDDVFALKPISLLEGTIDEYEDGQFFVTDDNTYYLADDIMSLDFAGDMVVHCVISESSLLKTYNTKSISEAKSKYSEEVFEYIYFGTAVFEEKEDYIVIKPSLVTDLLQTIRGVGGNTLEETEEYQEKLIINADFFDSLLKIKTNEELRTTIVDCAINAKKAFNEVHDNINQKKTSPTINLFAAIYETIIGMDDADVMKDVLSNSEKAYLEMINDTDNFKPENKEEATKILNSLVEDYKKMQSIDDMEEIKKEMEALKDKQYEKIQRLSVIYEEEKPEKAELANVEEKTEIANVEEKKEKIKDVREAKKFFDEKIIGQEEAKKDVIQAIYMNKLLDDPRNKNNCLLVGPTGSGKTLLAETVGEFYDMPVEIVDTTQITVAGYVGANVEDCLSRLLIKTKGDLEKAERGIIVFDEIDKKGSSNAYDSNISGTGVLHSLLPFISGTTYEVSYNDDSRFGRNSTVIFDTSKLTIFATGAFTELAKDENADMYGNSKIGFGSTIDDKDKEDIKYRKFDTDDYVKKGHMPAELIGRFSVITQLSGHTVESLRKILTESNASALLSEKKKLEKINIELKWTDGYLDAVAKRAIKLKTGARSLKSTVDTSIKEARWEVLNNLDIYKAILLTEKSVNDNKDCVLIDYQGNSHNLKEILDAKDKTEIVVKELVK